LNDSKINTSQANVLLGRVGVGMTKVKQKLKSRCNVSSKKTEEKVKRIN